MNRWLTVAAIAAALTAGLAAQSEAALKQYFEGRKVVVKINLPATKDGADVDVFPTGRVQMDYKSYGNRLKTFGVALHDGDSVLVTLVKVKKNQIEFQLGGGGYGTAGDETDTSVHFTPASKSTREQDLEKQLDAEKDPKRARVIKDELDTLRWQRERDDDRRRHQAEAEAAVRVERIQEKRLTGGSRFNLYYGDRLMPDDLKPERVVAALSQFLSFPWLEEPAAPEAAPSAGPAPAPPADPVQSLRKGLTRADVEALLGSPRSMNETTEGGLKLLHCVYEKGENRVEAVFTEDVLIRYTISSR
ncbi:MAG TPA: hypothetical protein PKN61_06705 [Acidobacteriota bacterium]|nr:hypothetical protein [Acidobacteriota bacterium]HNR38708.1 hypothetical protein [Acidobacteriota bacterium]HNU00535.1 hypothetical protein [Acidobacteriota bacterium]HPB27580.1 hypothetical protein [Acidobacteriota bacterium]HQO24268.1 hypothetical protein [Acidobacteriota bacterium]